MTDERYTHTDAPSEVVTDRPVVDEVVVKWEIDDTFPDLSYLERTAEDHYGKNGSEWRHVSEEDKEQTIAEHGSIWEACLAYADEDAARLASFGHDWWFEGCFVKATVSYSEGIGSRRLEWFTSGGLWGIESDTSQEHRDEVIDQEIRDLRKHLARFGIDLSNFDELAEQAIDNL